MMPLAVFDWLTCNFVVSQEADVGLGYDQWRDVDPTPVPGADK